MAGFNPADLWPSSRLVGWLSGAVQRAEKCRDTVYGILDGIIKEDLEIIDTAAGAGEAKDLLDVLLKMQKDGSLQIPARKKIVCGGVAPRVWGDTA